MNELQAIEILKKSIKGNYGKPCKDKLVGCPLCNAYTLMAYLNWYEDLLKLEDHK